MSKNLTIFILFLLISLLILSLPLYAINLPEEFRFLGNDWREVSHSEENKDLLYSAELKENTAVTYSVLQVPYSFLLQHDESRIRENKVRAHYNRNGVPGLIIKTRMNQEHLYTAELEFFKNEEERVSGYFAASYDKTGTTVFFSTLLKPYSLKKNISNYFAELELKLETLATLAESRKQHRNKNIPTLITIATLFLCILFILIRQRHQSFSEEE